MLDKLHTAMEKGDYAIGIFIDFRNAVHTVDQSIILYKLYHYAVSCGVPQGSILGPLFFLIDINDIGYVSNKLFTVLFADDTNLFDTNNDLKALIDDVNAEFEKVINWLNANKLSLNIDKTHLILFRNKVKMYEQL